MSVSAVLCCSCRVCCKCLPANVQQARGCDVGNRQVCCSSTPCNLVILTVLLMGPLQLQRMSPTASMPPLLHKEAEPLGATDGLCCRPLFCGGVRLSASVSRFRAHGNAVAVICERRRQSVTPTNSCCAHTDICSCCAHACATTSLGIRLRLKALLLRLE